MTLSPSMSDAELVDAEMHCPHIVLRFKTLDPAVATVKALSFASITEGRVTVPAGVVLRIFGRGPEGSAMNLAGALAPAHMLEAAEKATKNGAYVAGAGFVGADTADWLPTFDRVMALTREGPQGTGCQLFIPASLRERPSAAQGARVPSTPATTAQGCSPAFAKGALIAFGLGLLAIALLVALTFLGSVLHLP